MAFIQCNNTNSLNSFSFTGISRLCASSLKRMCNRFYIHVCSSVVELWKECLIWKVTID